MKINLNQPVKPDIKKLTKYLEQVNESGFYTNFGPLHQQLTERLEEYLGVKNLLLVSNCTLALQVAYKALNVTNALTTPFSFVATTSSLIWQEIEISFSDIDRQTYNLCPQKAQQALDKNVDIDTIVATHVYGNPCDVKAFDDLARKNKITIIYDAAHAFGVNVSGKSVLTYGDASTLSFHATKVFHTVEGGAIVFKHEDDFERAKRLINFGIDGKGNITEAGINAKLNEYQCAVGLTLLDDIDSVIEHRTNLFNAYRNGLKNVVEMPQWYQQASFNGAYMPVLLANGQELSKVTQALTDNDIQSRHYFSPSLDKVFIDNFSDDLDHAHTVSAGIICLPLHTYMSINDVEKVISVFKNSIN